MKMKTIILPMLLLCISACGGGGGATSEPAPDVELKEASQMELNKTYKVEEGQAVVRNESGSRVKLETDIITGETYVTLLQGAAVIEDKDELILP